MRQRALAGLHVLVLLVLVPGCSTSPPEHDSTSVSALSTPVAANNSAQPTPSYWSIPGLEGAKTMSSKNITLPTGTCRRRELKTSGGEECILLGAEIPGRPEWHSWECTSRIWAFDVGDKPFAYVTYVTRGERNTKTGQDVAILEATYYEYRDDDGDGRFETRVGTKGPSTALPAWAQSASLKGQPN